MRDFMDTGFHSLALAHALLDYNFLIHTAVISLCPTFNFIKADRHRRNIPDCLHKYFIILHTAQQLRCLQFRQRFPLCLGNIKYCGNTETWNGVLHFFHFRGSVRLQHRLHGRRIDFFYFLTCPDRCRGNDLYSLFSPPYLSVEFFLPGLIPCHQACLRLLQVDQQSIIKTVAMEL